MNVLLLSMPDSFEHMSPVTVSMPNGALSSLAGNVDPEHQVSVADLILVQNRVRATVAELVRSTAPAVVGLSVMTFQRRTSLGITSGGWTRRRGSGVIGHRSSLRGDLVVEAGDAASHEEAIGLHGPAEVVGLEPVGRCVF